MANQFELITNYIDNNFLETTSPKEALSYLFQLEEYLSENSFLTDLNLITNLAYLNQTIASFLETIYYSEYKDELQKNAFLQQLSELYFANDNTSLTVNETDDLKDFDLPRDFISNSLKLYFLEISKIPLLSETEEKEIIKEVLAGNDNARKRLIEANLPLVVSIAKKFIRSDLPFQDIIEEGNYGLMKAILKFDPNKGNKFSTFATFYIKGYILKAIYEQSKTIKRPFHHFQDYHDYSREYNRLMKVLNREPEIAELAKALNMSVKKVRSLQEEILNLNPISLETKLANSEDFTLADTLVSPETNEIDSLNVDINFDSIINSIKLTPKQKYFAIRHYKEGASKAQIAKELGCSRANIKYIEEPILSKIKQEGRNLGIFFDLEPKSFYDYFETTKEIIDYIIVRELNDKERYVLYMEFGLNLQVIDAKKMQKFQEANYVKKDLFPKIRRKIREINQKLGAFQSNSWLTEGIDVKASLELAKTYSFSDDHNKNGRKREISSKELVGIKKQMETLIGEYGKKQLIANKRAYIRLSLLVLTEMKDPDYISLVEEIDPNNIVIFLLSMGITSYTDLKKIASWTNLEIVDIIKINETLGQIKAETLEVLKAFLKHIIEKYNYQASDFVKKKEKVDKSF